MQRELFTGTWKNSRKKIGKLWTDFDVDLSGDVDFCKSTSWFIYTIDEITMSLDVYDSELFYFSLSSTEAEYLAISLAIVEHGTKMDYLLDTMREGSDNLSVI